MDECRPVRREALLDPDAVAALLRSPDRFDPAAVLTVAREAFGPVEGLVARPLSLGPGDALADPLPDDAKGGFLLDLDPAGWRSEWGGLLLFQGAGDRLHGYRPVPGALTLFAAATRPLISLITPQGTRRTSILGWWR